MPTRNPEALDAPLLIERQESFRGGVDAFQRATLLREDQCALLENMIVESDMGLRARPGVQALLPASAGMPWTNTDGLAYYDTPSAEGLLLFGGGTVWAYTATDGTYNWDSVALTGAPTGFPAAGNRLAWAQGIDKLLISDGEHQLAIWDGATWANAGPHTDGNAPTGASILLWHGANPTGNGSFRMFASGVPGDGSTTFDDQIWVSDALDFSAGKWNWTTWSFRVGAGDGQRVTALASAQAQTLVVGKAASIWLVTTPADAASAADYSIQLLTAATGITGPRAVATLGNDVLAFCTDGHVRSIQRMAGAAGQFEVSDPLSLPLQPWLARINWAASAAIVATTWEQFAFFAVPLDDATEADHVLVYNGRTQSWCGVWHSGALTVRDWLVTRFADDPVLTLCRQDSTQGPPYEWGLRVNVGTVPLRNPDRANPETFEDWGTDYTVRGRSRGLLFGEPEQDKDLTWLTMAFRQTTVPVTVTALVDEEPVKTVTLAPGYSPVDISSPVQLPFELPAARVITERRGLNHLPHGVEWALEWSATGGDLEIKRWSLAALPGMLRQA